MDGGGQLEADCDPLAAQALSLPAHLRHPARHPVFVAVTGRARFRVEALRHKPRLANLLEAGLTKHDAEEGRSGRDSVA